MFRLVGLQDCLPIFYPCPETSSCLFCLLGTTLQKVTRLGRMRRPACLATNEESACSHQGRTQELGLHLSPSWSGWSISRRPWSPGQCSTPVKSCRSDDPESLQSKDQVDPLDQYQPPCRRVKSMSCSGCVRAAGCCSSTGAEEFSSACCVYWCASEGIWCVPGPIGPTGHSCLAMPIWMTCRRKQGLPSPHASAGRRGRPSTKTVAAEWRPALTSPVAGAKGGKDSGFTFIPRRRPTACQRAIGRSWPR